MVIAISRIPLCEMSNRIFAIIGSDFSASQGDFVANVLFEKNQKHRAFRVKRQIERALRETRGVRHGIHGRTRRPTAQCLAGLAIMNPVSLLAFWADWRRDEAEAIHGRADHRDFERG